MVDKLKIVRSGFVYLTVTSTLRHMAQDSVEWASRGYSRDYAYSLTIGVSSVSASANDTRVWGGRSLRCLSTVLGM